MNRNDDDSGCWYSHQWKPWKRQISRRGEGWESGKTCEFYRECYRCDEFQIKPGHS